MFSKNLFWSHPAQSSVFPMPPKRMLKMQVPHWHCQCQEALYLRAWTTIQPARRMKLTTRKDRYSDKQAGRKRKIDSTPKKLIRNHEPPCFTHTDFLFHLQRDQEVHTQGTCAKRLKVTAGPQHPHRSHKEGSWVRPHALITEECIFTQGLCSWNHLRPLNVPL